MSHPTSSQRATSPTVEAVTRRRRSAPHQQPGGASDLSLKRPHRPIPDHHSSRSTPDDSGDVAMPPEATAALPKQGRRRDTPSTTPPRHHKGQRTGGTPPRPAPDLHSPAAVGGKSSATTILVDRAGCAGDPLQRRCGGGLLVCVLRFGGGGRREMSQSHKSTF
jgi:hypothetical protein